MSKHEEMMILPVETRREFFRKAYALALGRLHADGKCAWPIERLPAVLDTVMAGLLKRRPPCGPAFEDTKRHFGLKTQKQIWVFLESE